ncbi:MAG: hypothetical protein Q8858_12750 [Bacteroidota bacterium]|nr:hypothetical protein [Bacteroidota bacterium]
MKIRALFRSFRLALLKYPVIFLAVPILFISFKVPAKLNPVNNNNELSIEGFKDVILSRPLCVVESYESNSSKNENNSLVKIPTSALFKYGRRTVPEFRYRVVRIKTDSTKLKLRSIRIHLIKEESGYAIIEGLVPGDSLLMNPKESLKELVTDNKMDLREAFARN